MIRASISEIKNQLSRFLKLVQEGAEVEILDRDRPVARIVGISGKSRSTSSARLKQMEKDGLIVLGTGKPVPSLLRKRPGKGARVLEAILEERHR